MQPLLVRGRLRKTLVSAPGETRHTTTFNYDLDLGQQSLPVADRSSSYLTSRTKRAIDVSAALILLLSIVPIFCAIIALIRFSSPGPSLFKQLRYGRHRESFFIYKFRSMYCTTSCNRWVEQAKQTDSRVTPIGKIIRRTSIDELPQLINVLKGEMSLIGPRPHALTHDDHYTSHIVDYEYRFLAKPGMTGLAQVSGSRGATPKISDMKRRVDLDIMYIQQASLILDCRILLRTIREIFASETAY